MKKTSVPIIFFGNERLATGVKTTAPILRALIESGYDVKAVVSSHAGSQSRNSRTLEIAQVARDHHLPLLLPAKLSDIKSQLIDCRAEVGILVAYGKMVPESIINLFPGGIINIHPSLLPLHRGPTPIESVILGGDKKTGVSIMRLAKAMDAGPIYAQSELPLTGNESKQALADGLLDIGRATLLELLPGILRGSVVALAQDNNRASYDSLLSKDDGIIDWHKSAVRLEREVRAFAVWPASHTQLAGKQVIITKAQAIDGDCKPGITKIDGKRLVIYCGGRALEILELKPAGKAAMTPEAFIAGYDHKLR